MVGSAGNSAWTTIKASPEFSGANLEQLPNPLDRWTKRIGCEIASQLNAEVVFPFEGPPYFPFLSIAQQLEPVEPSKLGLFIHPQYGLWHAYRFALLLNYIPTDMPIAMTETGDSICSQCIDSPCLTACPVDAFSYDETNQTNDYDVQSCVNYLKANPNSTCNTSCLARNACPVGNDYRNTEDLQQFHIQAFLSNY